MKNLKAVLFDLDGTLVDSESYYFDCWVPVLKQQFGIDLTMDDWVQHFVGHTLPHNVKTLEEVWDIRTTEKELSDFTSVEYKKRDMATIPLMQNAKELVLALKNNGIHLAVVTSSHLPTLEKVLGAHGMLDNFDFFVTRENVVFPKPHPEPYLVAQSRWNFDASTILVLEDSFVGCTAAKEAGLTCYAVNPFENERKRLDFVDGLFYNLQEVEDKLVSSLGVKPENV